MKRSSNIAMLTLFCGCTAATSAFDYHVDDTAFVRDYDYTFTEMGAHAGLPLDIALVDEAGFIQTHARVYLPPKPDKGDYPDVRMVLANALGTGAYEMDFYIDDNENYQVDTEDETRKKAKEHTWVEPVSATGKGTFKHATNFRIFDTTALQTIGGDVVLRTPAALEGNATVFACYLDKLRSKFEDRIEVRVYRHQDDGEQRLMGFFRTYAGVSLPREIRLKGIVDKGSHYRVVITRDDTTVAQDIPQAGTDITVDAADWAGFTAADLRSCL